MVSASAEQGIALFTQWLGINLAPRRNFTNSATDNISPVENKKDRQLFGSIGGGRSGRTMFNHFDIEVQVLITFVIYNLNTFYH